MESSALLSLLLSVTTSVRALLCLARTCELALNWCITGARRKEVASITDNLFKNEAQEKRISFSVFRIIQYYLCHIPYMIKAMGTLRTYSFRCMEKATGVVSTLIKPKVEARINTKDPIERHNTGNHSDVVLLQLNVIPASQLTLILALLLALRSTTLSSPEIIAKNLDVASTLSNSMVITTNIYIHNGVERFLVFSEMTKSIGRCCYDNSIAVVELHDNEENRRQYIVVDITQRLLARWD
ncbi:hypothetical protein BCV71DRAFT_233222 [Rhizopus microsporus]|uniref:Uncharacterized protein n=1 Tax=Rhizopus microsporus TaxID=58291 RepID=A0A1X0S7T7_RHIZD|nr:hypothetical protein BCV71DRAFT_233222 [Rhizopus microsporus]